MRVRFVTSSYIFDSFFFCVVVEMGGVSSKITQATYIYTDELFTNQMILYVHHPVYCTKKNPDDFFSCHFNSILNHFMFLVIIIIIKMKCQSNILLDTVGVRVNELDCLQRWDRRHASIVYYQQLSQFNKDEYIFLPYISLSGAYIIEMIVFDQWVLSSSFLLLHKKSKDFLRRLV
jgi:hypothetical protein